MTNQEELEHYSIYTPKGTRLYVIEIIAEGLLVRIVTVNPCQPDPEFGKLGIDGKSFIYSGEFKVF